MCFKLIRCSYIHVRLLPRLSKRVVEHAGNGQPSHHSPGRLWGSRELQAIRLEHMMEKRSESQFSKDIFFVQ